MLTPFRVDTNSLLITEHLEDIGLLVTSKTTVGDDVAEIRRLIGDALGSVDLVICTGGLGPTEDDVTREAVASALGVPLEIDEAVAERIRERFRSRGLPMPEINRRQALVPRGAQVLDNANGTAPGLWMTGRGTVVVLLPGPPREMAPMLETVVRDRLRAMSGGTKLVRRTVRIAGRSESEVDTLAKPLYERWRVGFVPVEATILASVGQIELHLTARAERHADAERALEAAVRELEEVLGSSVVSADGRTLEAVIGSMLRELGWTIAVAESCTGGLLASRLTDVPGSSAYVERGAVCYSNRAKTEWLGVPESMIARHGAVSEPVAKAMAEGIRTVSRSNVGIGVTGIAGPDGGTAEKPVGTVAIAVVSDYTTRVRTFKFLGNREHVKEQAVKAALDLTRLMLVER
jgi:nicotinamide-nucleotide amidase